MSMRETDLVGEVQILKGIHFWNPNFNAEMTTLVSALGGDTTTHSAEIEAPVLALRIDASHTRLTNDAILLVNSAKAGNLTKFQIIAAFDDALGIAHAPANVAAPYASANATPAVLGTVCTVTLGQWTGSPTGYTYVWTRDGTNIGGATAATYTLVAADIGGHAIRAVVTATNATGSTAAPPSNVIVT